MSNLNYQLFYRRHLPHYQPPGATIFVTFRLAGSLPLEVIRRLAEEATRIDCELDKIADRAEQAKRAYLENKRMFGKWDDSLDANCDGPHWLQEERIAAMMADSLHYRDGRVYTLDGYCIMSNHVHVVCTPLEKEDTSYYSLSTIMHSLKRHVARQANEVINRDGPFWQHENYDHVVRDEAEYCRILKYVLNNPVKAGRVPSPEAWEWSYSKFGKTV